MKLFLSIGCGAGIGYATAERFAQEGYRIILTARNAERTNVLVERLITSGFEAEFRQLDASDCSSVLDLITAVEAERGAIAVLHYNAANLREASLFDQPAETFNSDLAVNIGGALAAAQAVATKMRDRGAGTLLFTGGFFGITPSADLLSLSIGKAGIRALVLALFEPLKKVGIHAATVTIATAVAADSQEARDVADAFLALHRQPKDSWLAEVAYPSDHVLPPFIPLIMP